MYMYMYMYIFTYIYIRRLKLCLRGGRLCRCNSLSCLS